MGILINVLVFGAVVAVAWGCLRLARKLETPKDGRRTRAQAERDAAKSAGYGSLEQSRHLGGGSL